MSNESDPLARLKELREQRSQQEGADLQIKRDELNKSLHQKKRWIPEKFERKHKFIIGGFVGFLILLYVGITTPYRLIAPRFMLQRYEVALEAQDYGTAISELANYLEYRPDEVEKQLAYSELLLINGDRELATTVLDQIIADSPLSQDVEVMFLSAIAALPNLDIAEKRNNQTIVSVNTYLPALILRILLTAQKNPDQNVQDISEAERQLAALGNSQQRYQRYSELLNLTFITICRQNREFLDHALFPDPNSYPQNLNARQQLIAGVDTELQINVCDFIPTETGEYSSFVPKLESIVYLATTYSAILRDDLQNAQAAIGQATQEENLPLTIFLDGVLIAQTGDFEKAITTWLRVGRSSSPIFRNNLSIAHIMQGPQSWDKAKDNLDATLRQNPNAYQALNNRAVLSIIDERIGLATTDLQQSLSFLPTYPYALYNQGIIDLLAGDNEQAIAKFSSINAEDQSLPGLHFYLARAYENQGTLERALSAYRVAVNSPRFASEANLSIGDYFSQDQISYEVALSHYEQSKSLDPTNFEAVLKHIGMLAKLDNVDEALRLIDASEKQFADLPADEIENYRALFALIKGQILFDNKLPGSVELLEAAFAEVTDEEFRKQLAILYTDVLLENDSVREALDVTRTILPSDPNNVSLLIARAKALTAIQDINQALNIILTAEEQEPDNYDVKLAKAAIITLDQRWQEAIDLYKEAFLLDPSSVEPLEEAVALLEQVTIVDKEKQLEELNVFLELASQNIYDLTQTPTQENVQLVPLKRVNTEEEIAQMNEQIVKLTDLIDSGQAEPYAAFINRGIFHSRVGNIDEAIEDMLAATQAEGRPENDYEAWVNLSQIYITHARYEDASAALTEALQRSPPNPTQLLFARASAREEYDPLLAIEDYDAILENLPSSFDAYLRRGLSKSSIGNSKDAIEDFSQAIRINPRAINAYQARMSSYIVVGDRQAASKDAETIGVLQQPSQ